MHNFPPDSFWIVVQRFPRPRDARISTFVHKVMLRYNVQKFIKITGRSFQLRAPVPINRVFLKKNSSVEGI